MKKLGLIVVMAFALALVGCGEDGQSNDKPDSGQVTDDGGGDDEPDAGDADVGDDAEGDADVDLPDVDGGDDDADGGDDGGDGGQDTDADDDEACGEDGNTQDSDGDGLYDCEEENEDWCGNYECDVEANGYCTDPHSSDTDDDGLNDAQELAEGTDPCDPDTDGDGVEDGKEIELGLDPTEEETFEDGVKDGDRWIVGACEDPQSEPLQYTQNSEANWKLALPSSFDNNRVDLDLPDADTNNRWASTIYENPTVEVSGFVFSDVPDSSASPSDLMDDYQDDLETFASDVERTTFNPREFVTHDYQKAQTLSFDVTTSSEMTPNEVREELLFDMAPFEESDVDNNLPTAGGSYYEKHRVTLSVIRREYDDDHGGGVQSLVLMAVAPAEKIEENAEIGYRMDDLTNTTNIASSSAGDRARCDVFLPEQQSMADFYWVLDQSGSMSGDYETVRGVANDFFAELENTSIDYRLGVTTTDKDHNGRLVGTDGDDGMDDRPGSWDDIETPGWHTELADFEEHVKWVEDCGHPECDGGVEWGLRPAQEGIEYMKGLDGANPPDEERIRDDASLITIWMSDEEDNELESESDIPGSAKMQQYVDFFSDHTTGFAMVDILGDEYSCGLSESEAYPIAAQESGGTAVSICANRDAEENSFGETIQNIINEATRETAQDLPESPISSSLRVVVAEKFVPRNDQNGFQYFSDGNSVAFFGDYRPDVPDEDSNEPVDHISITYENFSEGEKEFVDQGQDDE